MVKTVMEQQQLQEDWSEEETHDDDEVSNNSETLTLDIPSANNLRKMVMESTDSLELLAQKAKARGGGQTSENARFLFVTTWLLQNYEVCPGNNVPRHDLYNHYCSYCVFQSISPVNSASFGKLIRSVFLDLKTKRLGTRGQSKYHYCGIRAKPVDSNILRQQLSRQLFTKQDDQENAPSKESEAIAHPTLMDLRPLPLYPILVNVDHTVFEEFARKLAGSYQKMYECSQLLAFNEIEHILSNFWGGMTENERIILDKKEVIDYIISCDSFLYDKILNFLIPNVLHFVHIQVIQAIRHFARHLEGWLIDSLRDFSPVLVARKVEVGKVFTQQLRRQTSLNHLAQAAASILENQDQVRQMLMDWKRMDYDNMIDQASWICECQRSKILQLLEVDFTHLLEEANKLEHWTTWLEMIVDQHLTKDMATPEYVRDARHFLMKWSFYSSLCMRDLTLRSAPSFGSFHIIRLLFDEFIFYLVEKRLAESNAALQHKLKE